MIVRLTSQPGDDQGTPGILQVGPWWCHTLELPWRDNQPNVSCIPAGEYPIEQVTASRSICGRRVLYLVQNVPGRSGILLHAGTWAGNKDQGFKADSLGCPLMGYRTGRLQSQRAILSSRVAVGDFMQVMGGKPGTLIVERAEQC